MPQPTINTPRETTHQRIADALEDIVDKIVDTSSASNIDYDNTQSGLSANKVQGAVDELASEKADKSTTLAGYGITDAYTKAEVYTQSEVNNIVSTLETNIDWKEAVNTYSDIATTYPNPQDGWTVNVKDTDYTYRYNGSEWVAISANAIPEATTSVKGLMTPTQVSKLNGIEAGAQVNTVTSVAGKTGAVTLTKSDVGLGNVDNTSDLNKPISTAAQTALNSKVDKVAGKGLSTNDYTNEEKQKNADNASAIEDIQEDISTSLSATGNPLTIQSSESNLVECVAEVEAVQDLHGYDHPWVGGAGKNKLDTPTTTIGGITFTEGADGYISATPTTGDSRTWSYANAQYKFSLKAGNYKLIIDVKTATTQVSDGYSIRDSNNTNLSQSGDVFKTTGIKVIEFSLSADSNIGVEFKQFEAVARFMIMSATETDSSFAPYTNISPITGQTEVVIEDVGKNLFKYNKTDSQNAVSNKIPWKDGLKFKYFGDTAISSGSIALRCYDGFDNELSATVLTYSISAGYQANLSVVTGTKYVRFTSYRATASGGIDDYINAQFMVSDDVTSYEPYAGKTYTIQLGDTIYGGELDVITGELTVTHGEVVYDGSSDEGWNRGNPTYRFYIAKVDAKVTTETIISNQFMAGWDDNKIHVGVINGVNSIDLQFDATSSITTVDAFKTYLASNPLQVVYELATPFTIQLTPQQIRLLKGTNNISCNTGDLSIKYYPDNVLGQLKGDIEKGLNAYYEYQIQALWDKIGESQA